MYALCSLLRFASSLAILAWIVYIKNSCVYIVQSDLVFRSSLMACLFLKQGTMAERANAFRQQCELAETVKLKEIDLYGCQIIVLFVPHFLWIITLWVFVKFHFINSANMSLFCSPSPPKPKYFMRNNLTSLDLIILVLYLSTRWISLTDQQSSRKLACFSSWVENRYELICWQSISTQ